MIKIGDKVKFDKYIPKNYLSNKYLKKTLNGKKIIVRRYYVIWSEDKVNYNTPIVEDTITREGIYVGTFRKKLVRRYNRTRRDERELEIQELQTAGIFENPMTGRRLTIRRLPPPVTERYSTDPARLDNPRKLDKMAMVNYKGMLLGIPMCNIYKCTYEGSFEVIS